MLAFTSKKIQKALTETGRFGMFSTRLFGETWNFFRDWRRGSKLDAPQVAAAMETVGFQSLPVVLTTALFTGMVLALQASDSLEKILMGISQFIGRTVALPFVRELGPVLTALIVTGRIGSGIAAEIGTMQVTEQVDALSTLATPPLRYLGVPRLLACVFMLPLLTIIANVVGILGGWLVALFTVGISSHTYFGDIPQMLTLADIWKGALKAPFFGAIIALVSCYQGFGAQGGAEGVGQATTRAVVVSSILILIADYFLTAFFLLLFR
jgi:phospholipid/cholesterol/gamma-HCH transport system permease protein